MTMAEGAAGNGAEPVGEADDGDEPIELTPADEASASETGRLAFGDDEVRLPWLEADDDEEEYQGYNTGQLASLIVLGVLALAVIVGGIWWATHHGKEAALVADGSVIPAPKQPYKEKPKDPGGKTFAGTGDTSFAVSEGKTRPARLGESAPARPASEAAASASAAPAAAETVSGVGVQIAAYSNRSQAEAGWTKLSGQYEVLSGLHHRVVEGQADIGTVYRLQAVPGDAKAAHALCAQLKSMGVACQVKN
jgi:hypothetical protein